MKGYAAILVCAAVAFAAPQGETPFKPTSCDTPCPIVFCPAAIPLDCQCRNAAAIECWEAKILAGFDCAKPEQELCPIVNVEVGPECSNDAQCHDFGFQKCDKDTGYFGQGKIGTCKDPVEPTVDADKICIGINGVKCATGEFCNNKTGVCEPR